MWDQKDDEFVLPWHAKISRYSGRVFTICVTAASRYFNKIISNQDILSSLGNIGLIDTTDIEIMNNTLEHFCTVKNIYD